MTLTNNTVLMRAMPDLKTQTIQVFGPADWLLPIKHRKSVNTHRKNDIGNSQKYSPTTTTTSFRNNKKKHVTTQYITFYSDFLSNNLPDLACLGMHERECVTWENMHRGHLNPRLLIFFKSL